MIRSSNKDLYLRLLEIDGKNFAEKSWKFVNSSEPTMCKHCSTVQTKFISFAHGYRIYCSPKCQVNSKETIDKKKATCLQKYGTDHFSKTADYKKQFVDTCMKRHGVSNPGQIRDNLQRRSRKKQLTFFNTMIDELSLTVSPLFDFDDYTHVRDNELAWKCNTCKNEFTSNLFGKLPVCPTCYPSTAPGGPSTVEIEVLSTIREFYSGNILQNSRTIISPKELDLYFPDEKFAIEINGTYWHSQEKVGKTYHRDKFNLCNDNGISLLMITDLEWKTKKDVIIQMIKHRLGISKSQRYSVRKTVARVISRDMARPFLNKHHIGGSARASMYYGLFSNDVLIAVASTSDTRFRKSKAQLELVRFASPFLATGALGKLLKLIQTCNPMATSIISYADYRYGTGKVYEHNGFNCIGETSPGYWYVVRGKMFHRLSWTKRKLVKMGYDEHLTEREIMKTLGAHVYYDCGHRIYELELNK